VNAHQRGAAPLRHGRYNVGLRNGHGTAVLDQLEKGRDPDEFTTPGLPEYEGKSRPDYGAATWRMRESFAAHLAEVRGSSRRRELRR
jgi:hypothetical protein